MLSLKPILTAVATALLLAGCGLIDLSDEPAPAVAATGTTPVTAATPGPVTQTPVDPTPARPSDFAPTVPVRMAFIWYDLPALAGGSFMETRVQLTLANGFTRMRFPLPQIGIDCSGVLRFSDPDAAGLMGGEFQISCSDNSLVSGLIVPVEGQSAINGQGADQAGRSVIFAIQMDG